MNYEDYLEQKEKLLSKFDSQSRSIIMNFVHDYSEELRQCPQLANFQKRFDFLSDLMVTLGKLSNLSNKKE